MWYEITKRDMNKRIVIIVLAISLSYSFSSFCQTVQKPKISFSFDDGSVKDFPAYDIEIWNQMLLDNLKKHDVKAVLFIKGSGLHNAKGADVIQSWDSLGHLIGNHTYKHAYFNSDKVSID